MAKLVGLPKLSPTMDEGTLVRWTKAEGELVEVDELLAEVETDKATMEFRSFDSGTLLKILAEEGTTLAPDAPVAIIGKPGEDVSALVAQAAGGAATAPAAATPAAPAPAASPSPSPSPEPAAPAAATTEDGRVLASPLVRKLARENGIALAELPGSGPGGRVIKRDLDAALDGSAPAAAAPVATPPAPAPSALLAPRVEKASQMRKTIARRLTESKQQVPHFYLSLDVDAEALVAFRAKLNKEAAKFDGKVSFNDLVVKASAVALRRVPGVNASFAGTELHYHQRVDISVAVAVPDGLVTPVVRDADRLGVLEISREIKALAGRARDKKLAPEDMQNGTFSVSNLGMFGIANFQAVINPPEGGILAVGALRDEPVVKDGRVLPGKRMGLTLSCDHRVVDGALAAEWLSVLRGLLENPLTMML